VNKRVLMIAYHYPPCRGSSGLQRSLNFTRQLPTHGWDPILLTVNPRAYPECSADQLADIPSGMTLERIFALDSAKDLSIKGRYVSWTALPDRWISWMVWAVPAGLRMIRKHRPQVLWSTYPIATALWIGYALHRSSGIPWVVDVRDPLTEEDPRTGKRHPPDPKLWRARRLIEERAMLQSARAVLVTPGARKIYADRYAAMPSNHWAVIPNGYAEESFAAVERNITRPVPNGRPLHLLHSGILYPTPDRDPRAFFAALGRLRASGRIGPGQVRVTLRASGYDHRYREQIHEHGLDELVQLAPPIPYRDALAEMLTADGLLVFQGYTSNPAVPAKLYEYLRAKRPIFALVDAEGDTAATLRAARTGTLVPLESSDQIEEALTKFIDSVRAGTAPVADETVVMDFARELRTRDLGALLDEVVQEQESKGGAGS
jgi:glycosyltransferase involved in cell wall biosynthesis